MRKEDAEFVAVLMAETPASSPYKVANTARELIRLGKRYAKLQEIQCERDPSEFEERAQALIERRVVGLCQELGAIEPEFSGDPRGATIKLKLPSGRSNSFAGERYCVPWS